MIDYILLVELCDAFDRMGDAHGWDLSPGETAPLLEVFYSKLRAGFPNTKEELNEIFEEAYVHAWGADHECDETKPQEMETLIDSLFDSLVNRGFSPVDYLKGLGLQ